VLELWKITEDNFVNDDYGFSKFATTLNTLDEEMENVLLPTDSRRRLDRSYLEKGDYDSATKWKRIMEEKQRADKLTRAAKHEDWVPVWFKEEPVPITGGSDPQTSSYWTFKGKLWEERERGQSLIPLAIVGLACDFTSYEPKSATNTDTTLTDTDSDTDKENKKG